MRKGAEKLGKFLNAKQQGRLDGFFSVKAKSSPTKKEKDDDKGKGKGKGTKRKVRRNLASSCMLRCTDPPGCSRQTTRRRRTREVARKPRRKSSGRDVSGPLP